MKMSETAVVYECWACGYIEVVDSKLGEQPPDVCPKCGAREEETAAVSG
ncbi:MAG: hypothetical protein WC455_15955 [Dehalococcoidia bacterium]|jgi:rubrerythrin